MACHGKPLYAIARAIAEGIKEFEYNRASLIEPHGGCPTFFGQVPWHAMGSHDMSWHAMARAMAYNGNSQGMLWQYPEPFGMALPWHCSKTCHGIAMECHGMPWIAVACHGTIVYK